ncbi:hypothetical protein F2Q69_00032569 [Brassica cretica]|uniref:Uncharacterized protein n=1 Tax=Brassica cretica TaxID=69181 RepID=A0A8S9S296_BRACR|nr:hypothetical protein F2Q69_00032569 [Brassica cretica]
MVSNSPNKVNDHYGSFEFEKQLSTVKKKKAQRHEREREERETRSTLGPAYGRRVSTRAVAGALSLSSKLFLLAPSPPSCQRPPCPSSGTATIPNGGSALGMEGNIDPSSSVYAGGGGLLRSTVADFSFREGEFPSAPPSPAFSYGEWRLASSALPLRNPTMKLSGGGNDFQGKKAVVLGSLV